MMKRIVNHIIWICVAICISIVISSYTSWIVSKNTLEVLFTLVGILFSVGVSLTISLSTSHILNPVYKKEINKNIDAVSLVYFSYFLISIIIIIITPGNDENYELMKGLVIFDIYNCIVILYVYFIIRYLFNFYSLKKLFRDIESKIDKEKNE